MNTTVPVHRRSTSCFVCGAPADSATERPACPHDWTNAEALADALAHDLRSTVVYSSGATSPDTHFVLTTRGV